MSEFKGLKTISRTMLMALTMGMFFSAPGAYAAEGVQKIGIVDYNKIFVQMPETKVADKSIQEARAQNDAELSRLQNEIRAYVAQKEKAKKADPVKEKALQAKELDFRKSSGEREKKVQDMIAQIRQKIDGAIQSIARKDGYTVVLEKSVVYSIDAQSDITFKVLDQLNIK
ncbi:MAG: OmpH family outer membrane protein [Chlorobiaceae bacterium]|nr:OmpH family outer membrane protein [Chlorobiaceae bacterium]